MEIFKPVEIVRVWFSGNNDITKPNIEKFNVHINQDHVGVKIQYREDLTTNVGPNVEIFIPNHNVNRLEIRN